MQPKFLENGCIHFGYSKSRPRVKLLKEDLENIESAVLVDMVKKGLDSK
jgi:hypothetical protein